MTAPCRRFVLKGRVALLLILLSLQARALEYPWILLSPENDSRDPEMRDWDDADSLSMVGVMNQSESLFNHHLVWKKAAIKNLLALDAPFCEMRFDAVHPGSLSAEEKSILGEYFKRGGFILFFVDSYPYSQDEFWPVKKWSVIDFLTKDLPASDPEFTTGRATDDFPIFTAHYRTETPEPTKRELANNPNTPNRIMLFYRKRLCSFVIGRYSYMEDGAWVPMPRPFPTDFSMDARGFKLVVNIYIYSMVK